MKKRDNKNEESNCIAFDKKKGVYWGNTILYKGEHKKKKRNRGSSERFRGECRDKKLNYE